jgi:transposase
MGHDSPEYAWKTSGSIQESPTIQTIKSILISPNYRHISLNYRSSLTISINSNMCLNTYMKSFTRVKVINGQEYLYEITPYYDKEKKQIRQKSKYLGKNLNGFPVKVRSRDQVPKKVLSYGEFIPLRKISNDLDLDGILSEKLPAKEVWSFLSLAMNYVIRPRALNHIQSWYEGTILAEDHPDLPLSSQSLSRILSRLGESTTNLDFSRSLIQRTAASPTLIYDITSLSSYSKNINLLEYGYNRDGLDLPQINLSLIVDKELGIPLMYDVYPGSIVDVSTLKNTIKKINAQGVRNYTLIMDRGFFSTANIEELMSSNLSFIIPPTSTLKSVREAISSIHSNIDDPQYLKLHQKEPLFVMPVNINIGEICLKGYAYYDQRREQQERNTLYKRLYDLMERLKSVNLKPWMNPGEVFREIAKKDARFIEWRTIDGKFEVALRKNAISQAINKLGKFILLYQGQFSWEECLSLYRGKDAVEKGFDILKNDIDLMPAHVRTDSTLRGYLFIAFLALILRMKLRNLMVEAGLSKRFSVDGLMTELEKIKVLILPDGQKITTEVSRKQREILNALNMCA